MQHGLSLGFVSLLGNWRRPGYLYIGWNKVICHGPSKDFKAVAAQYTRPFAISWPWIFHSCSTHSANRPKRALSHVSVGEEGLFPVLSLSAELSIHTGVMRRGSTRQEHGAVLPPWLPLMGALQTGKPDCKFRRGQTLQLRLWMCCSCLLGRGRDGN